MAKVDGDSLTKTQLVKNEIYSAIGVDIQNIANTLPPEIEVNEYDVLAGLIAYYTASPRTNGVAKQLMLLQTNAVIRLDDVKPSPSDEWIFLGIMSEGRKFNLTSNILDMRLTGIPLSFMMTNPMQNSYYSTIIDLNMGKPEYFVDEIRNEIIITAGGDVILSLRLCWMSTDIEQVHIRHMRELARLISVPYYERLIALRSQAMFTNTDFSIDIGFIQSKLAENKQVNIEFLKKIRKYTILKG